MAAPDPLTPTVCDLRDFEFMPLEVRRLRDARIVSAVGAEEFRAALMLWCAAWHQVPAASVPDDDIELAKLAGYGIAVKAWLKVRKGALTGFVKCSDGRMYHPVVAEKAIESWNSKLEHGYKKFMDRLRKENKARAESGHAAKGAPSFEQWKEAMFPTERIPRADGIPEENALKGEVREGRIKPLVLPTVERTQAGSAVDNSTPDGDKSPENQRQKLPPSGWHKSNDGIESAAKLLGVTPNPGELHGPLKSRIFERISAIERESSQRMSA